MTKPAKLHTGTGTSQTGTGIYQTGTGIHQPGTGLRTSVAIRPTLAMGAVGAIVGGTAAAARNISRVNKNEITRNEAVTDSLKEAGTTGAATATATAVVSAIGLTGTISLVGLVAVAIGAKYAADKVLSGASAACTKSLKSAEPAAEAAADKADAAAGAKKTAEVKK